MNERIKNTLLFVGILLLWLLGDLIFKTDTVFYELLNIPGYAMSQDFMSTSWFIIYILITISILMVMKTTNILKHYDYLYILITNYLANQLFPFMFYTLKSPFFGFIMSAIIFISSIFLYIETKIINKKASYFLIPNIVFSIYALIIAISIYVMNF